MYRTYMELAPHPDEFPVFLDRIGEYMRTPYDWSDDAKKLTMPVMLVFGDSEMYRPEHIVDFYKPLGGGLRDPGWNRENMSPNRLAVLPGRFPANIAVRYGFLPPRSCYNRAVHTKHDFTTARIPEE